MATIALVAGEDNHWAKKLIEVLSKAAPSHRCYFAGSGTFADSQASYIYVPSLTDREGMIPDLLQAEQDFQRCAGLHPKKLVLLSSALIYGTGPGRMGLVAENYVAGTYRSDPISGAWKSLEALASQYLTGVLQLTILRPVTVLPSPSLVSGRLTRRLTVTLPGHDPTLQLLSLSELAHALICAIEHDQTGTFNVAPNGVVPFNAAVRIAKGHRIPIPRTLQRLFQSSQALEYLRYPWTVSNRRIKEELGFVSRKSSVATILNIRQPDNPGTAPEPTFDEFGMDKSYIQSYSRSLFTFLSDRYWRIEVKGLEHVPRDGPAILVGMHRGFMPWDGVMVLHLLVKRLGRYPRFLTHPGLFKFPFISTFVARLGGVVACQESADRVLKQGELLGVFPEGVKGAFTRYRDAYKLKSFGRDSFVKLALQHRAPIVPFVTVGSAEILPVFAQIKSRWWTRYADWPCIPISTFPFVPVPLPSKWHTQFLPAIHLHERFPQEAAHDLHDVKAISLEVKNAMQEAVDAMLQQRRSIFFGSIFKN
ncbi:MAG TPA: 1-acyl-sn-glycerol-3-phosphate acyltransferase [Candidatus Angelobacter sp.]|jgi:1-acyl-sn-glycerol-3-phosphate acyltransferase|nr:1-acyl-sn-glycerol-3-phosphate acyltransferase [Candidatus Angelobacter sp.]